MVLLSRVLSTALLGIVIILCSQSDLSAFTKDADRPEKSVRMISYNVWYGFTKSKERKADWLEWMQKHSPQIVSLQELNGYTPEKLKSDARTWGHQHVVLLKEDGFPTGLTSTFPIEDVKRFRDGFHHGLVRARIKEVYIYVIHLHPSNWEIRTREIALILKDIHSLPTDAKIILAGDFNTFSKKDQKFYAHGKLEPFFRSRDEKFNESNLNNGRLDYSVITRLEDAGFIDLENKFRKPGYEFTGSFPTRIEKPGEHGSLRRLDYVFVSPNLSKHVTRAVIVADDKTQLQSDHLPVIVDFESLD